MATNSHLLQPQLEVLEECLAKGSGGLSLPMGYGKTIIGLTLGIEYKKQTNVPFLVVCSKTLITNWEHEIIKFFPNKLSYIVFHTEQTSRITMEDLKTIDLILTTPEMVVKYYKEDNLSNFFISTIVTGMLNNLEVRVTQFNQITGPLTTNVNNVLFATNWSIVIMDELHKYNNIQSDKCRALCCLYSKHKWGLSGTMITNPSIDRIVGYYCLINDISFPRNVPEAIKFIRTTFYEGLNNSMIIRTKLPDNIIIPKLHEIIITHEISFEEQLVYICLKKTLLKLNKLASTADLGNRIKYNAYLLSMITFMRQSIICPLIPLSRVIINMLDDNGKDEFSNLIIDDIKTNELEEWLDDPNASRSSRISKILEVISSSELSSKRIIVFSSFVTGLQLLKHYVSIETNRTIYQIKSSYTINRRESEIQQFANSTNGIMMLTYEIGSIGLNLQMSDTIILMDFWWDDSTTQQSIGRVLRQGQLSDVKVYYFVSSLAIENAIFQRQADKISIIKELQVGSIYSKIKPIKTRELIKILLNEKNEKIVKDLISMKY